MKYIVLYSVLLSAIICTGQEQFMIQENGLLPKSITSGFNDLPQEALFYKALGWIDENGKTNNLIIEESTLHKSLRISFIEGNAVTLDKQYFNVKYEVVMNFDNGSYAFEPTKVQLKLNSKYDMGWKDFDLRNGSEFYKKGKPIRKFKNYLKHLVAPLNELHQTITAILEQN